METGNPAVVLPIGRERLQRLAFEFARYVLVGGLAFAVDFGLLRFGLSHGMHYLAATAAGFIAGLATNYALCVLWVWRGTSATTLRDFLIFAAVGLGGLALTELLMWVAVELLGAGPSLSKIIIAGLVLVWNFGLRRMFVFSK